MPRSTSSPAPLQGVAIDKFFYFFLGLRKGEIRRRVATLRARYPEEPPEQLARRLIAADVPLSALGGALLHLPVLVPGARPVLKLLGVAGATTALMRMQMALILEIALLFGRDIDERARVPEMIAVFASAGLASASPLLLARFTLQRFAALAAGAATVTALNRVVGEAAIRYYRARTEMQSEPSVEPAIGLRSNG